MSGGSFAGLYRSIAAGCLVSLLAACSGGGFSPSSIAGGGPAATNATSLAHGGSIAASRSRLATVLKMAQTQSGSRAHSMAFAEHPSNETTADPPVAVPDEAPCVVQLYSNFQFTSFSYPTFQYTPPANCPGPWNEVVLNASFAVSQGIQYDRTGSIWIDGTNIYFGTTAEPAPGYGPSWKIQKDVTNLTPIFETPSTGEVVLGNIVNSQYTGVISSSATLSFYPATPKYKAASVPDDVYPMSGGPLGDNQYISTPTQPLTGTFTLPTNVEAAYLDVYLQSQIDDEFWYSCFPDDLASEIPNCPNTAFREGDVSIDGQAAGIVPIYPWIFTGGLDPYLWQPIPGVDTLNFKPYRINLTPFASILSNGQPHTINITVFNNGNYYAANAALQVYLDHGSTQVTGSLVSDGTTLTPSPVVTENVPINAKGFGKGTVSVTDVDHVSLDGYVNTSQGRVETQVTQTISFSNSQAVYGNTTGQTFDQTITQNTSVTSDEATITSAGRSDVRESKQWPLNVLYNFYIDPTFTWYTQRTQITQGRNDSGTFSPASFSPRGYYDNNTVTAADYLYVDLTAGTATPNASTSQTYKSFFNGQCWNKTVTQKFGAVTSQTGGSC